MKAYYDETDKALIIESPGCDEVKIYKDGEFIAEATVPQDGIAKITNTDLVRSGDTLQIHKHVITIEEVTI